MYEPWDREQDRCCCGQCTAVTETAPAPSAWFDWRNSVAMPYRARAATRERRREDEALRAIGQRAELAKAKARER